MNGGVKTNGVGRRTDEHLNLKRSLAEVWGLSYAEVAAVRKELHGGPAYPTTVNSEAADAKR